MLIQYLPVSDAREAVRPALAGSGVDVRALTGPGVRAWAAQVDGEVRAVIGARLRHVQVGDPDYTYMPERYAIAAMSMWHVAGTGDWAYAPDLLDHIARDAARAGIDRLSIEIPIHHGHGLRVLLGAGFVPDVVLSARAAEPQDLHAPGGVVIRRAHPGDAEALLALTLEEADYHAHHTRSGIRADQAPGPSREFVERWIAQEGTSITFVAESHGQVVGMAPLMLIDDGDGTVLPETYGYIASTVVTAAARGRGIGRALARHVLAAAHRAGMRVVLLHYVADNPTAAPLWEGLGFTPLTVTLTRGSDKDGLE